MNEYLAKKIIDNKINLKENLVYFIFQIKKILIKKIKIIRFIQNNN